MVTWQMVLLIDNYDSFTFNLAQYLGELGADPIVRRNDALTIDELRELRPDRIVISPGPGRPEDAGISVTVVKAFGPTIPILGVCLGHQAIGFAFGAQITPAKKQMHGKSSLIAHDGQGLFQGIQENFSAGLYHSLVVSQDEFPLDLEVSAWTDDGDTVMALRHRHWPVYGVQFHPESVLTNEGHDILRTFLKL